jgi:hypothetical protein
MTEDEGVHMPARRWWARFLPKWILFLGLYWELRKLAGHAQYMYRHRDEIYPALKEVFDETVKVYADGKSWWMPSPPQVWEYREHERERN